MLREEILDIIRKNKKLVARSIKINPGIPETFILGDFINSNAEVKFDKKEFKKLLSKLGLESLNIKVSVNYLGLGFITYYNDDGKNINLSFFGARYAVLEETNFRETSPGDSITVPYLSTPYLVLPSVSFVKTRKKEAVSNIAGVFVIHKYKVDVITETEGEEIILLSKPIYPNIMFPSFKQNKEYPAYQDLIDIFKKHWEKNRKDYYYTIRKNTLVIESSIDNLPLRTMIISPFVEIEQIDLRNSTENIIKKLGFGNIAKLANIDLENWEATKNMLLQTILKIKQQDKYTKRIRIVIAPRGEINSNEKITLRISTGVTIEIGDEIIQDVDWIEEKKFKLKDFRKRKDMKIEVKIPRIGSSFYYKPGNEDIKFLYELVKGKKVEIKSYYEFDVLANELSQEKILIKGFKNGFSIYPHIKIEVLKEDEVVFEQTIPQIYSIEIVESRK